MAEQIHYLVNAQLVARPIASLLDNHAGLEALLNAQSEGATAPAPVSDAIAVSPDGALVAGQLYDSSTEALVRYYLPTYQLNVVDGRYTTSLKFRGAADDPTGPLGWLTIELEAVAPPRQRFIFRGPLGEPDPSELPPSHEPGQWQWHHPIDPMPNPVQYHEIDHQAVVRIGYQLPIMGGSVAVVVPELGGSAAGVATVPTPSSPVLWIEVGALEHGDTNVRRCKRPIATKEEFDRIFQIMTDSSLQGHLEVRCLATIGHRTWRQIVVGPIDTGWRQTVSDRPEVRFTNTLNVTTLQSIKPDVLQSSSHAFRVLPESMPSERATQLEMSVREVPSVSSSASVQRETSALAVTGDSATTASVENSPAALQVAREISPESTFVQQSNPALATTAAESTFVQQSNPALAATVAGSADVVTPPSLPDFVRSSDLSITVGDAQQTVVPVTAAIDRIGRPVLLRVPVETDQQITPFWFAKETNAYMFDLPGDLGTGTNHVLIRQTVVGPQGSATFYQDSAFQEQLYYQPSEFRLARAANSPYLPALILAFYDAVGAGSSGDATAPDLFYRVVMSYKARPYLDPALLALATTQFTTATSTPHFTAINPVTSKLRLLVPSDQTNGSFAPVDRPDALIDFDAGIIDSIELSSTELSRVFAFFNAGSGLDGQIQATLLDNTAATVPLNLSLSTTTGTQFETVGSPTATGAGHWQTTVRNHIESAVRIDTIYPLTLAAGVIATPQTATGQTINPGAQTTLDYLVTPVDAPVSMIEPSLATSIVIDPHALWPQLMINKGFTSDTFTIKVEIAPSYFTAPPPAGVKPLVAVHVEFEADTSLTLTAAAATQSATLRVPLLRKLLKEADLQHYRYRVTNIHADGPGAQTGWQDGENDLQVAPAPIPGA